MKKIILAIIIVLIFGAVIFWVKHSAVAPISENANQATVSYKDLTYNLDGHNAILKNGKYDEKIPDSSSVITTSYFGNEAKGDLNSDNKEDVAFLLQQEGGGTGIFYYLAVAIRDDKGYRPLNTIFLGDRIAPQNTQIKDGIITVNYADRLPTEAFSAEPSVGVSRIFKVDNGNLLEIKGEMGN